MKCTGHLEKPNFMSANWLDVIRKRKTCQIGIGPVSKNTVDAVIEVAHKTQTQLMLIPSRRQVDSKALGGGYVEKWTTQSFAEYVRSKDRDKLVLLCRDHGGPWQNTVEIDQNLSESEALKSCLQSFREDMDMGFHILHIDSSVCPTGEAHFKTALKRLLYLYEACYEYAKKKKKNVAFELGPESQKPEVIQPKKFKELIEYVKKKILAARLPDPLFVVVQTGTKVVETRNVGALNDPEKRAKASLQIEELVSICNKQNVLIKAHNGDYLSDASLAALGRSGIGGINIAPEFGVVETRTLLELFKKNKLKVCFDRFVQLTVESGKWKKWMAPNTAATDLDRTVIAGHYLYATDQFRALKDQLALIYSKRGESLDDILKNNIALAIERYLKLFGAA